MRRLVSRAGIACAVALTLALAACDSVEDRVAKHYARGLDQLEQDQPAKARLEFRNVIKLDADHVGARFELARLREEEGEVALALRDYRRVIELDPLHVAARLRAARIYLAGGAAEEAAGHAAAVLTRDPQSLEALTLKAMAALRTGDAEEAIARARAALAVDPASSDAVAVLIGERMQAEDFDGALAMADKALAERPDDLTVNVLKLRILASSAPGAPLGAHLERLADLYPDDPQFRRALAAWRNQTGDVAGAVAELRTIAEAAPDDAAAAIDLVRLVGRTGGYDAAAVALEERIAAAQTATVANRLRIALAELEFARSRPDEARALFDTVLADQADLENVALAKLILARRAQADGDAPAARALVDAVLAGDPANASALALHGELLIAEEKPDEAVLALRRAIDVAPDDPQLHAIQARAYQRAGNRPLSLEHLAKAARLSEFEPRHAVAYARALAERDQLASAESILVESVRRNDQAAALWSALGRLRIARSDWAGAEEAATRLAALPDGALAAQAIRVSALAGQGRQDESMAALEQLAAQDVSGAFASLVRSTVRSGDREAALRLVEERLEADPTDQAANLMRAEFHLAAGELDEAAGRVDAVVSAHPQSPAGYLAQARLHLIRGDAPAAEASLRKGVETATPRGELRLLLGQLMEQTGRFGDAIAAYRALYEESPDSVVVANNLASLIAEHQADDPESLAYAGRLAQRLTGSEVPYFQDTLGWIQFLRGDVDGALRSLVPAAEQLPNVALVRYHLGRALAAAGRADAARGHLEAALALDPGFPKAGSARETLAALAP